MKEFGKTGCLETFTGDELLGLPLKCPLATYEKVYTLPLLTISMFKGTGVVKSVPSDAHDDYIALKALQERQGRLCSQVRHHARHGGPIQGGTHH
jgi:leucyl-tRNA synthetase